MEKDMDEIQNHLVADSGLVKKGTQEITVKLLAQ